MQINVNKIKENFELSKKLYNGDIDLFRNAECYTKTKYLKNFVRTAIDKRTALLLYTFNNNKDFNLNVEDNYKYLEEKIHNKLFQNNFTETLQNLAKDTNLYGDCLLKSI